MSTSSTSKKANVGLLGLGVMGSNLARNIERNGYVCAVFNKESELTDAFMGKNGGKQFVPSKTLPDFVKSLAQPRQIFMMITAGKPVDIVLDQLLPLVEPGDIIIDGGNSYFKDTQRRTALATSKGVHFLGIGVSGGEEGALNGASIMPGGPKQGWEIVAPMLSKMAAVVEGEPCTSYVGPDGAGHFVKMVHNGIEYGDMQLIAEAYDVLRRAGGFTPERLATTFEKWNSGVLQSFLIEITAKIFKAKDEGKPGYLVDAILDKAGQKGTGAWTAQIALDLGVAIPTLAAAVDSRILSSLKTERVAASSIFTSSGENKNLPKNDNLTELVHDALYAGKIISYAQGMALIGTASKEYNWGVKLNEISALWRGGCIIRARFLNEMRNAYRTNPDLSNLMLDSFMKKELARTVPALRSVVKLTAEAGIPALALASALSYFDAYRSKDMPQNLTQGQRDYFGAHTYERLDTPGKAVHTDWSKIT